PRSDLVLFVTSADRPFTESERAFLQQIRDWGKKIVFVVNKIDILERPEEVQEVVRFVSDSSLKLLGVSPEVFPISARLALRAKLGDPGLLEPSRFEALERYIRSTLDEASRVRLKLLNPVGVARQLAGTTLAVIDERRAVIREDVAMLDDVERQLGVHEQDMTRDFRLRMAEIEKILVEMESRGHEFFDEMLRIGRVFDLVNTARVQAGFEQQVVADVPQQIERKVGGLVDWLVDADFRQWQAVTGHLAERRRAYRDRIVGDREESGFHYDRSRLIDSVGREAQRVVDGYDRAREARAMADGARNAVATAAAMGAGALGLGTIVSLVASTAAADVTGLVAASALAVIGFFILPARRRAAKQEMRRKVTGLREGLGGALQRQFEGELQRSIERLRSSIAPYTRFVRAEGARLDQHGLEFRRLHDEFDRLATRIEAL
ncbi:MAG TPA: dynamin family protein, partial [Candidatus Limnocylindrales bacterium]|nr:dynamin family protein [Candidatus Limnocylindrales bacterium]